MTDRKLTIVDSVDGLSDALAERAVAAYDEVTAKMPERRIDFESFVLGWLMGAAAAAAGSNK